MSWQIDSRHDVHIARTHARNSAAIRRRASIVYHGRIGSEVQYLAGAVMVFIDAGIGLAMIRNLLCHFVSRYHRDGGVMYHAPISGEDFGGLNPSILREICRNVNVFVVVHSSTQ